MTTSTPGITEFRTPPPYADLSKPAPDTTPRLSVERLNELDLLAQLLIATKRATPSRTSTDALRTFRDLSERDRIYVALAASDDDLLHFLRLSIAEAIDKLGWIDASAMVARWSKRRG